MRNSVVFSLVLGFYILFAGSGGLLLSQDIARDGFRDSWLVRQDVDPQTGEDLRMPLLMPDDFSELHLVGWRVELGTQDSNNPLIEGDMPWDSGGVGIHGSVLRDPVDSLWKAYLVSTEPEVTNPNPERPWKSRNTRTRRICLFESTDGVHWSRPELSNVPFEGHSKTNIIFDSSEGNSAYASVFIDPELEWPYEMIAFRAGRNTLEGTGYYRYRSMDGRKWESVGSKIDGPMKGDLSIFYRDPDFGYVAYYRLGGPHKPTDHVPVWEDFQRRSCYRAVSKDGWDWKKDHLMTLTADERDHRDTQYQETVPMKVKGGYIAIVNMYHPILQTLSFRAAASRDGRRWWFPDRRPCLDNGPLGDYGGGMLWQSQNLIVEGDRLHVYYGGTEGPHRQVSDTRAPSKQIGYQETVIDHGAHFIPFNSALCRASWRLDRTYALASSAGGPTLGVAVTTARELGGKSLFVNLVTRPPKKSAKLGFDEGYLQVELLDADGQPIPGFTRDDCVPLKGDHKALSVQWAGGVKAPNHARKAKFYLKRAFLYGFDFRGGETKTVQKIELRPYAWEGAYSIARTFGNSPHDDGLCAEVRAPWMQEGERLILRTSEIVGYDKGFLYDDHFPPTNVQGREKGYEHNQFRFDTDNAPDQLSANCIVPGKGRFQLELTVHEDTIDIDLTVRNDLDRPMEYIDWYFCPLAFEAPSIGDPKLERTYLFDGERLRQMGKMKHGGKKVEVYAIGGEPGSDGFVPPLHAPPHHPRGAVEAKAPIILVESVSATHTVALAFERGHSIYSSPGNRCFHADPYFGMKLQPGEERKVRGKLYLMKGSAMEALSRIRKEFGF